MKTDRKKTKIILRIVIIIALILAFLFVLCAVGKGYFAKGPIICTSTQCFKIEIADTPKTREIGLMNRTTLDKDKGMLFVFEQPGIFGFRMKNTLIPLDMLRLDENYKIIYIQNMAQPCTADPCQVYNPGTMAKYVLEFNGGTAEKLGIKVGESMTLKK